MSRKKKGLPVHGIINLDKPAGLSSNQALQQVKRLFRAQKAGHTGSLDPLATGVLPLCFGHATKISSVLLDADKTYQAGVHLGISTDTGDAQGNVVHQSQCDPLERSEIETVAASFVGKIKQVPPMYSALKKNGKPLYLLARQGLEIEREAREIEIFSIKILHYQWPRVDIEVCCSKGTYIRTLAEDMGNQLGCGAHLYALRRIRSANFTVEDSFTLAQLGKMKEQGCLHEALLPIDYPLQHWPRVYIEQEQLPDLQHGRKIKLSPSQLQQLDTLEHRQLSSDDWVRIYDQEKLLALAIVERYLQEKACFLQPKKNFSMATTVNEAMVKQHGNH